MENTKKRKILATISVLLILVTVGLLIALPFMLQSEPAVQEAVVVKSGASGSVVKDIQRQLNNKGFNAGKVDGIFGSNTTKAVKAFQKAYGLKVDGIVGKDTAKALGVSLSNGGSGNSNYNGSDVYLLAKAIHAEARGEPYIGQVAVGAVILNRVKSPEFPNTISGVIYQPWAFTAVHDGQINLEPNDSAMRAAKDAMNGWDPTNGCIYYFNPATATSKWIWSRPVQLTIGKHKFAI